MVSLLPTPAQDEVRNVIARYLGDKLPVDRLRKPELSGGKADQALWADMAALGLFGLGLPSDIDGAGFSAAEEILAFRELGRFLISPSVFATTLAARLALNAGQRALARDFVNGRMRASLALPMRRESAGSDAHNRSLSACDHTDGDFALYWDLTVIGLLAPDQLSVVEDVTPLDDATSVHRLDTRMEALTYACSAPVGSVVELHATLLASAMLAGVAEETRDMAVAYAKLREQFGRPIGSFQAVKHKCADMAIRAEMAWAQTVFAAISDQDNQPDLAFPVMAAKTISSRNALANATDNIQIHGAIGFTLECHAHRFLKRAHLLGQCGGSVREKKYSILAQPAPL